MSNSNQRPWYKDPRILFPAIVAIIVALIVGFFALYAALPQTPTTPTFKEIGGNTDTDGDYEICWERARRATFYILQEDEEPLFTSPKTLHRGLETKKVIYSKPRGDYYYRVRACNDAGESEWSPTRRIEVIIPPTLTPEQIPTPEKTPTPKAWETERPTERPTSLQPTPAPTLPSVAPLKVSQLHVDFPYGYVMEACTPNRIFEVYAQPTSVVQGIPNEHAQDVIIKFDVTNPNYLESRIVNIYIEVIEYYQVDILKITPLLGVGHMRNFFCNIDPELKVYVANPLTTEFDYIKLSSGEIEYFGIHVNTITPGVYKLKASFDYSIGGVVKHQDVGITSEIGFFSRESINASKIFHP
jgi:hypothetical protein